ncbi:MAG: PilN domain-containing protein [Myxococcota bacterium]
MIRINLLPVRQTQKRQSVQQQLLIGVGVLVAIVVASVVWTAVISSSAEERKQAVAEKQNERKQLDKIIGEVNAFTEKKKELEEKLDVIDGLSKAKIGPVRALDDLATEIPNRVWVTKMGENNGSVTIEGRAIDPEDVSSFLLALQKSKYFSGIVLTYSKAVKEQNVTIYEYKITCQVNYSA